MRRGLSILISVLLLSSPTLYAEGPGGAMPAPAAAQAGTQIGIAAAVRGSVQLARTGQAGRLAHSGEAIHIGDVIATDDAGQLQIILLDETVFTIGPSSSMTIDEFIYDPTNENGTVKASITKGVFRFVTGKIAHKKPSNMEVKVPTGTIGVRGTMTLGSASALNALVILMGPGEKNNSGDRVGSLILTGDAGGKKKSVYVTRPGYGSEMAAGSGPTPAFDARDQIAGLQQQLAPKGDSQQDKKKSGKKAGSGGGGKSDDDSDGDDDGGSKSASEQAGQDTAAAGGSLKDTSTVADIAGDAGKNAADAAQDSAEDDALVINDGIATKEQLRTVQTGQFFFKQTGVPLNPSSGSYTFQIDIDFGARTVGGGESEVAGSHSLIDSGDSFDFDIPAASFASGNGNALFVFSGLIDNGGSTTNQSTADVTVSFNNSGGNVALNADHSVSISDSGDTVTGSGNAGRNSGLSS
ncbi:MAG: FecR family protein [Candidatus Omnitrophota bacterium]|nr:FecR family protein [Candidatus Omnitrophota bacterium]